MPLQILILKLHDITAGDYLTWCRDPDPPGLDFALRSVSIEADPCGDTIIATLDWNQPVLAPEAAATAAGLPLPLGVQLDALVTDRPHALPVSTAAGPRLSCTAATVASAATVDGRQPLQCPAGVEERLHTAI